MKREDIIRAWVRIREVDDTIPDEVIDFMKDSALRQIDSERYAEENEAKAIEIFKEKFDQKMLGGSYREFVSKFRTLFNKVIIPSVITGLNTPLKVIPPEKLQAGDWFSGTPEQYKEMLDIESHFMTTPPYYQVCVKEGCLGFNGTALTCRLEKKQELSVEVFRYRAKNTFPPK